MLVKALADKKQRDERDKLGKAAVLGIDNFNHLLMVMVAQLRTQVTLTDPSGIPRFSQPTVTIH